MLKHVLKGGLYAPLFLGDSMKHLLFFIILVHTAMYTQSQKINLLEGCNALYTKDAVTILGQFKSLADKETLKEYEKFMITTKLKGDIRLKMDVFEDRFTSGERVLLRTPLQKYSDCRTRLSSYTGHGFQTVGPSKALLSPCEKNYAIQVQEILNKVQGTVPPDKLLLYREFMITLKYHTDLDFESKEFEKRSSLATKSRLQFPLHKYLTCRDSIIRLNMLHANTRTNEDPRSTS